MFFLSVNMCMCIVVTLLSDTIRSDLASSQRSAQKNVVLKLSHLLLIELLRLD